MIEDDGWYLDRTRGSHKQYKHPTKLGVVTIAGKPNEDVSKGTLIVDSVITYTLVLSREL